MKLENNWRQKSLESLEKNTWPALSAGNGSYLMNTCHSLRKKQLQDFTTEDLRINDERWRKVLNRFESLEAELQELYWEILEFLDKEHEIQIH